MTDKTQKPVEEIAQRVINNFDNTLSYEDGLGANYTSKQIDKLFDEIKQALQSERTTYEAKIAGLLESFNKAEDARLLAVREAHDQRMKYASLEQENERLNSENAQFREDCVIYGPPRIKKLTHALELAEVHLAAMIGTHGEPCANLIKGVGPCFATKEAKDALAKIKETRA